MSKFHVTDEQLLDLALKVIAADEDEVNGLPGEICVAHILANSEHALSDEEVSELLDEMIITNMLHSMVKSGQLTAEIREDGEVGYSIDFDDEEDESGT